MFDVVPGSVGLEEDDVPEGDWWCSDDCRQTKVSIFCICKKQVPGLSMMRCGANEKCTRGEWFHQSCMKIDPSQLKGSAWFCCTGCKGKGDDKIQTMPKQDHVYKHTCAIMWRGLNDLMRRDAVREGDGMAIIAHWRIDMVEFWNQNHKKYLILGHRLLAGVNGWLQPRLAHEVIWNRTANIQGKEGRNVEMDLVNEFLNNDFKENLKHARGQYTPKHVARTAQIVGSLGKEIDTVYMKQVVEKFSISGIPESPREFTDIVAFITQYEGDELVTEIPGREHKAFPQYFHCVDILNPAGLKKEVENLFSETAEI